MRSAPTRLSVFALVALGRARGAGKLLVASISGPWRPGEALLTELDQQGNPALGPSCFGGDGDSQGTPAVRLRTFIDSLGEDGVYGADVRADICSDSYERVLDELASRIRSRLTTGCLPRPPVDGEGYLIEAPDQAQCAVTEIRGDATGDGEGTTLPPCALDGPPPIACAPADESPGTVQAAPCWDLCDSAALAEGACPRLDGAPDDARWQLRVRRDGACDPATAAPADATTQAACATCEPASCRQR